MNKQVLSVVVALVFIAAVVYTGLSVSKNKRAAAAREANQREWASAQYSQEIVCDKCGEHTSGLVLNRAQVGNFQECPKCGEMAGRPIVYFMCMKCDRQLIKVRNTVWTGEDQSPGDAPRCPQCGRVENVSPDFLPLKSAQKVANETGQEFP